MSRFTKLAADGQELAADATGHVAVRDNTTGLIWSAATLTDGEVDHRHAEKVVAECRLMGADDWRLPTIEELFLLADRSRNRPAIDTDVFRHTRWKGYWSATRHSLDRNHAWLVDFSYGHCDAYPCVGDNAFVRTVRGPVAGRSG